MCLPQVRRYLTDCVCVCVFAGSGGVWRLSTSTCVHVCLHVLVCVFKVKYSCVYCTPIRKNSVQNTKCVYWLVQVISGSFDLDLCPCMFLCVCVCVCLLAQVVFGAFRPSTCVHVCLCVCMCVCVLAGSGGIRQLRSRPDRRCCQSV